MIGILSSVMHNSFDSFIQSLKVYQGTHYFTVSAVWLTSRCLRSLFNMETKSQVAECLFQIIRPSNRGSCVTMFHPFVYQRCLAQQNVTVVFLHEVICRCHFKVDFFRAYSLEKQTSF